VARFVDVVSRDPCRAALGWQTCGTLPQGGTAEGWLTGAMAGKHLNGQVFAFERQCTDRGLPTTP
jgi:hypothetical protein